MMIATDHLMCGEDAHSQIPTEQELVWSRKTLIPVTVTLTGENFRRPVYTIYQVLIIFHGIHCLDAMLLAQILETCFCYSLSLLSTLSCPREVELYYYSFALYRGCP